MTPKHYALLFIVAIIPFIIYSFNPNILGADTYFYVNQICGISEFQPTDIGFDILVQILPCNFLIFKTLLFFCWFGCLVAMSKIAELYDKERGVWGGLIMAGLSLFILSFFAFENDVFGYLFFFWSLFFVVRYSQKKSKVNLGVSFLLIIIGGLFWKGVAYWILILPLFSLIFIPLFLYIFITHTDWFFYFLNSDPAVAEQARWIAVIYWGMTVFFSYGFLKTDKKIVISMLILAIPALFMVKLYVLCIPFIVLIAFNGIKDLKFQEETKFYALVMFALILGGFFAINAASTFPTVDDMEVIQYAISLDSNVENVFGAGYLVIFNGGTPSARGGTYGNDYVCDGIVIERPFSILCDCEILAESTNFIVEKC